MNVFETNIICFSCISYFKIYYISSFFPLKSAKRNSSFDAWLNSGKNVIDIFFNFCYYNLRNIVPIVQSL